MMGFSDWFKRRTPLTAALERGMAPGGDLVKELDELDEYPIRSSADAEAICNALKQLLAQTPQKTEWFASPLHALIGLFQKVPDAECPAIRTFHSRGVPLLISLADKVLANPESPLSQDLLFALKILGLYGTPDGADAIVRIARAGIQSDAYLWSVVLGLFGEGHPDARRVFGALSDPLPKDFIAVSLLDAANRFFLAGNEMRHPFDTDQGIAQLERWLQDQDPDKFSYAISTTASLPFLTHPAQEQLLAAAMRHPDESVQMEAAWAATKLGNESGLNKLAELCLDFRHSARAKHYLEELGQKDAIPPAALAPEFEAKAEFAQWLSHPNELGRAPDGIELADHRVLAWPPALEPIPVWLLKYTVKATTDLDDDNQGIGMVGSTTWCFFSSYELDQRPPEDAYAIHCCWELEHAKLLVLESVKGSSREYDSMLSQWTDGGLTNARICDVIEVHPDLQYPRRMVAVAAALYNGTAGWVVLDGPDSTWYPEDTMPPDERPKAVLWIHLGRQLLKLPLQADRKAWFKPPVQQRPPEQIIAAYEQLLHKARHGSAEEQEELLKSRSPLNRHFNRYVEALLLTKGAGKHIHVAGTYETLLEAARQTTAIPPEDAFDSFTPLGEHFLDYVDALYEIGRIEEISPLIEQFSPYWQHNLGHAHLGTAAFRAGDYDRAESYFLKLKEGLENWQRSEEMCSLAEIWAQRGNSSDAKSLLIECMRTILTEAHDAEGSDIELYEEQFQLRRETYLRLFSDAAGELIAHGIPNTTLAVRLGD